MSKTKRPARVAPAAPAFVPPYSPSWVDWLTETLDRVPVPAWLTYLVLGTAGVLLQIGFQQSTGAYRPGPFLPFHIWMAVNFAYLLAMIYYLDRSAASALESFRPVLTLTTPEGTSEPEHLRFAGLRYQLTTLPARTTARVAVLGGLLLAAIPVLFIRDPAGNSLVRSITAFGYPPTPAAFAAALIQLAFTQAIAATVVYHTIHQLRWIHHIYVHHTQVNLYRLQPLYAFSIPAALTAGALLLYTYAWFGTTPSLMGEPVSRALAILFAGIAVITFTWPLWGIHRRLVEEKKRLMQESSSRFESAVAQLHKRVDRQRLTRMDDLNKTLASLEIEQAALRRIPTWPWEPGTVRGVAAALLLPVFVWLAQQLLSRFLTG